MMTVDFAELTRMVLALRREEGSLTLSDLTDDTLSVEELGNVWLYAQAWKQAATDLEALFNRAVVETLDGGSVLVGDWLIVTKAGYTRERCLDPAAFTDWLIEHPEIVRDVVNPNSIRFGSLPPAVRDTWFEKEQVVKADATPQASAIPVDRVRT